MTNPTDTPIRPGLVAAAVFCLAAVCATPSLANAPPPERPTPRPVPRPVAVLSPVRILPQKNGAPMRIEIPASLLGQGAAAAPDAVGNPRDGSAARTVIAGVSLSMAMAFGGLWFVRRRTGGTSNGPGARAAGLVIGLGLLGGLIASVVQADIAAPPQLPPPPAPKPSLASQVKVIPHGKEIRIHLSQKQVEALRVDWAKAAGPRKAR